MKKFLITLSLLLTAFTAYGDCTGKLSVEVVNKTITATFETANAPAVAANDPVSLTISDTVLETEVANVTPNPVLQQTFITFKPTADAKFENGVLSVNADISDNRAKLAYTERGEEKSVELCLVGQFNSSSQSLTVGAASSDDDDAEETAEASATDGATGNDAAIRVQFKASSRRFRETANANPRDILSARLAMTEFAVNIDTTDKEGENFVDDSSFRVAHFSPRRSALFFNRVRFGVAAQHARAFHGNDNNSDVTVTLDGWVPFVRALNIGTPQRRLALPLNFRLSAGNRWQDVDGISSQGPVAEWSFLYHAYFLSDYRLDLEHRTVFNDVEDRPASTPRTQHTWKATLFMFNENSRFNAVASYENGHSGPVFTQLRQYFVGVGIKNLLGSIK